MDSKIRIVSGLNKSKLLLNAMATPPMMKKNERATSAISKVNRKIEFDKSSSPSKSGLKKLNVNVNVNLNGNNDLPHIMNNASVTPIHKYSPSIFQSNIQSEKSPINRILPNKFRIVSKKSLITEPLVNEENLKLKSSIQKLKTEVAFHRGEFLKVEAELKLKEKLIEELLNLEKKETANSCSTGTPSFTSEKFRSKDLNLIVTLKKNLKENQALLKMREEEIEKMKKLTKITKVNELFVENRTLNEELHKIKTIYDNYVVNNFLSEKNSKELQRLQSTVDRQQNLTTSLQEHNNKLIEETNKKSEWIEMQKEQLNKLREELTERLDEIEKIKMIAGNEKENDKKKVEEMHNFFEERNACIKKKKEKGRKLKNLLKEKAEHFEDLKKELEDIKNLKTLNEESQMKLYKKKEKNSKLKTDLMTKKEEIEKLTREYNNINKKYKEEKKASQKVFEVSKQCSSYEVLNVNKDKKSNEPQNKSINISKNKETVDKLQNQNEVLQIEISEKEILILKENKIERELSLTEEQFNAFSYILGKNFEVKNIDANILQEKLLSQINNKSENFIENFTQNIMGLLNNKNPTNKKDLINYLKYFNCYFGKSIETFRGHFVSLFNPHTKYSNEDCKRLDKQLARIIFPQKQKFTLELKKNDFYNFGYISFINLRKTLEFVKIELDAECIEYFIYKMKLFDDPLSSFTDLKYGNIIDLLKFDTIAYNQQETVAVNKNGSVENGMVKVNNYKRTAPSNFDSSPKEINLVREIKQYLNKHKLDFNKFVEDANRNFKIFYNAFNNYGDKYIKFCDLVDYLHKKTIIKSSNLNKESLDEICEWNDNINLRKLKVAVEEMRLGKEDNYLYKKVSQSFVDEILSNYQNLIFLDNHERRRTIIIKKTDVEIVQEKDLKQKAKQITNDLMSNALTSKYTY